MKTRYVIKLSLILAGTYQLLMAVQSLGLFFSSLFQDGWSSISSPTLASTLYIVVVCFFLMFRSDAVIQLMRLEKSFEETTIDFSMSQFKVLLRIVVALLGLWAILRAVPSILSELIYLIREDNIADAALDNQRSYRWLLEDFFSLFFGFILVFNQARISNWIMRQDPVEP